MEAILRFKSKQLKRWILILFIFMVPALAAGQSMVNMNVVMKPPYSSSYSSYENLANHVVITIVNRSQNMKVYLTGKLTNLDRNFTIATSRDYRPAGASFTLAPNQTKVLINDVPLLQFLGRNKVTNNGLPEVEWTKILQDNQLPEGRYQLCVQAVWDTAAGIQLGEGCALFNITKAAPPVITMPQNGQTLSQHQPNIAFAWTPAIGNTVGANVVYDLYVVKVVDGQNPDDAINGAISYQSNNPMIKKNLASNQYVTQPYDLKIDTNTLYAVAVVAHDLNKKVGFKNNGRSEVVTFSKGELLNPAHINGNLGFQKKSNQLPKLKEFDVSNLEPVPYSKITGKLYYRFKDASPQQSPGTSLQMQIDNSGVTNAQINKKPEMTTNKTPEIAINKNQEMIPNRTNQPAFGVIMTGGTPDLEYNKDNTPLYNARPLAGKRISLVVTYVISGLFIEGEVSQKPLSVRNLVQINVSKDFPDADKVLATTVTQSDGSFTFNFPNTDKILGIIDTSFSNSEHRFGENKPPESHGIMYKTFRIRVEDDYFCSPDVNIKVAPWKGVDLGNLVSFVKSYTLKVWVRSDTSNLYQMAKGAGSGQALIDTKIVRKKRPDGVPAEEGESGENNGRKTNEHMVASGETDNNGYIIFKHLVQHNPDNKEDKYYIWCTPNFNKGNFIFQGKTQGYYPLYNQNDGPDFPFNKEFPIFTRSQSTLEPGRLFGDQNITEHYGSNIIWNSELEINTYETQIVLTPLKPRIAGKIYPALDPESKSMSNKLVVVFNRFVDNHKYSQFSLKATKTDEKGRYKFNNLIVETGEPVKNEKSGKLGPPKVIGPTRVIFTKVDGFKAAVIPQFPSPPIPPIPYGAQLLGKDLALYYDGYLSGYVVDEKGNAVEADIDIDGYTKTTTRLQPTYDGQRNKKQTASLLMFPTGYRQVFSISAPSGKRKITITPTDLAYEVKDTTLVVPKEGEKNATVKFVVIRSQKRIRFRVLEASQTNSSSTSTPQQADEKLQIRKNKNIYDDIAKSAFMPRLAVPIAGATVKLDIPGKEISQISDKDGYVTFQFDNSATDFTFIITPPADGNYEEGTFQLTDVPNTTSVFDYGDAFLKKAATITGVITVGPDKKPLQGATVYIELGSKRIESAPSDEAGHYVLKGVPTSPSQKRVWAGKSGVVPNIISQSREITIKEKNELDFNLITDNDIAIQKIFGFEAEIQTKKKQSDGTWLMSGNLVHLQDNENFSLHDKKQTIPFHDLKIKKSSETINGVPIGVPASEHFLTDLPSITLLLQQSFAATQVPSNGDQLKIQSAGDQGSLTGKIYIQKAALSFSEKYVTLNESSDKALLLSDKPGSSGIELTSIITESAKKIRYGLLSIDGKPLKYKLQGFDANADPANSWVQDNSINLRTMLHAKLPGIAPLDIDAGDLVIHPDKLDPLKSDKPITIKMEKWQITAKNWLLPPNSNTIGIASGTVKTGSIDIPVSDISLKPDHLEIGSFDVSQFSFANVIQVHVLTPNPVFGYNKSIGTDHGAHYELRLMGTETTPGVVIKDLPGMKPGNEMKFQNFSLVSNGDQILQPGNQGNFVTFYDVMKVRPISFSSGEDYVDMLCGIDFGIPQLAETTGAIQYYKEQGKVKMRIYPVNVSIDGPGGVSFSANLNFTDYPQSFSPGNFTALGTIVDKEGINLKGVLHRTTRDAWIQVDPENQKLPLGGSNTSLTDIKGKMQADMSKGIWNNFTFSGAMKGFTGIQGDTRKTFTVTGSINASDQKMDVKKVPTEFVNIDITYDLKNARLTGNLELDKKFGALHIAGTANFIADRQGWFFLSGGKLNAPGLGDMSAGILIGDYAIMPDSVSKKIMQFAYNKEVPRAFQRGISGLFFTGMKTLPGISIPETSINLGIINIHFGVEAGMDARLWVGFSDPGNEYGIGAMVFANAFLEGEAIICTEFSVKARAELGIKGVYSTSTGAFSLLGCGSLEMQGAIKQCIPYPCFPKGKCCGICGEIRQSIRIKVNLLLDSNGNADLSFGFGNCSGQPPLKDNF